MSEVTLETLKATMRARLAALLDDDGPEYWIVCENIGDGAVRYARRLEHGHGWEFGALLKPTRFTVKALADDLARNLNRWLARRGDPAMIFVRSRSEDRRVQVANLEHLLAELEVRQ